jgi:hypothetical protein
MSQYTHGFLALTAVIVLSQAAPCRAGDAPQRQEPLNAGAAGNPYGRWSNGPPRDPGFFPIAVWLQDPRNVSRYREAGFNVYVGLWRGPTEDQLAKLKAAGMKLICDQNAVGLAHRDDPTIAGWMHGDEPDNAQEIPGGKGYGPPILPSKIVADYERIRKADPSRPVMLNLGQGVAWDGWYGRGVRTNHPEDYAEYIQGCDIASFDIYPVVHDKPEVRGNLWYVPKGVDRLRDWSGEKKIVWNCIECTHIGNEKALPTPKQVRTEVWMSLIHGSMGLIYFVHEFKPKFIEAGLFAHPEILEEVTKINKQIHEFAPVLNSPTLKDAVTVKSSDEKVPIDAMVKRHDGTTYIFAVSMRDAPAKATFELKGIPEKAVAEVIGGDRKIEVGGGKFEDEFQGYEVKLFQIR